MASEHVDSTSDSRAVNNTMRTQYRKLTDDEKAVMDELRRQGDVFLAHLDLVRALTDGAAGREVAIARTKMEEAVMWAVKGLTQ